MATGSHSLLLPDEVQLVVKKPPGFRTRTCRPTRVRKEQFAWIEHCIDRLRFHQPTNLGSGDAMDVLLPPLWELLNFVRLSGDANAICLQAWVVRGVAEGYPHHFSWRLITKCWTDHIGHYVSLLQ